MELSINPNTIQRAYTELERRGVTYSVKGKGNFVADITALLALREQEIKADVKKLVQKAKEAGMAPEQVKALVDAEWKKEVHAEKKQITGGEADD